MMRALFLALATLFLAVSAGSTQTVRVGTEPSLKIGPSFGDNAGFLADVEHAIVLSDGRVAVADRGTSTVRFFSPTGSEALAIGGEGDGPGEFRWLSWIGECRRGSLWAFDAVHRRVTSIDLTTGTVDVIRFRSDRGRGPDRVACYADGLVALARTLGSMPAVPGPVRWPALATVYSLTSDGFRPATSITVPGDDRYASGREVGPRPLGRSTVVAGMPRGVPLAVFGSQDRGEVIRLAGERPVRVDTLRWGGPGPVLTEAVRKAFVEGRVNASASEARRRQVRGFFREHDFPERLPAHGRLLLDPRGWLWIESSGLEGVGASNQWRVMSPEGSEVASLSFPEQFSPVFIGLDVVAGIVTDTAGQESVWLLPLQAFGN